MFRPQRGVRMADEVHVFFKGKLPSRAAFNRAVRVLGHPASLVDQKGPLEGQCGFMPMRLFREDGGVEFDVFEGRDAVEELERGIDPSLDRRASFRWSGSLDEAFLGYCGAVALARLTGGVVLDEAEGRVVSIEEATATASALLAERPPDTPRLGTRPADLKRYLKPLLKLRPDLVLSGRLLFIRPVRHIVRGVYFEPLSNKYSPRIWRHISPLIDGFDHGYGDAIHEPLWYVYEPYFQPFLLDSLRKDVFDDIGQIVDLAKLVDLPRPWINAAGTPVLYLVLAGERDRAADVIEETERSKAGDNPYWHHWAKQQRQLLMRDVSEVCAEAHMREARMAEAMKLGDAWVPSPFAAELPRVERAKASSEGLFPTTPWIETPSWLLGTLPERAGEVRFAEDQFQRGEETILLVPLTREAAEHRHRTGQNYVLAIRVDNDDLVVLRHLTHWSPHDPVQPKNPDYVPFRTIYISRETRAGRVHAEFDDYFVERGLVKFGGMAVCEGSRDRSSWRLSNSFPPTRDPPEKQIDDRRSGERVVTRSILTEPEINASKFPLPAFGDVEPFLRCVDQCLQDESVASLA
jgi:hypothetical protein